MKKTIILLIFITTLFTFTGCKKKIEAETETIEHGNITYDKQTSTNVSLPFIGKASHLTISNELYYYESTSYNNILENNLILDKEYLLDLYMGEYSVEISDNQYTNKYILTVTSYNTNYQTITSDDLTNIEDDEYYVLFSRDNCQACENLKPKFIEFYDFTISYPIKGEHKIYYFDTTTNNPNIDEVTEYPTLALFKGGRVREKYVGTTNISTHMNEVMESIKATEVIKCKMENVQEITINLKFNATHYNITGENVEERTRNVNSAYSSYSEDDMKFTISTEIFNLDMYALNQKYTMTLYNDEESINVIFDVTGDFNYIKRDQIFEITDEKYYVFFFRDGCQYCQRAKPILTEYASFYKKNNTTPLYAVYNCNNINPLGKENSVGVSTIEDLSITGVPRLLVIENGVVTEALTLSSILALFEDIMK